VLDNPRNLPPGAFVATPQQPSVVAPRNIEQLSTLTSLSDLEREFLSIPKTHSITETLSDASQQTIITPPAPNSIRDRQALISHDSSSINQLPINRPSPANPHPTMSTVAGFRMLIRSTDSAPKYDGSTENLLAFIDDYEDLADQAGLGGTDRIREIIRYVPTSERELWSKMPEAKGTDYGAFIKEIKRMYPGCKGDRRYAKVTADMRSLICRLLSVIKRTSPCTL
jgi:hypothetical protein